MCSEFILVSKFFIDFNRSTHQAVPQCLCMPDSALDTGNKDEGVISRHECPSIHKPNPVVTTVAKWGPPEVVLVGTSHQITNSKELGRGAGQEMHVHTLSEAPQPASRQGACARCAQSPVMSDSLQRPHGPPGSSVYGISQARILEWDAISFSRRSSQPRDRTHVSCIAGGFLTLSHWRKWKWKWSHSVVSDSLRPHGRLPTRLLCPWDFPCKSTGVGCHFLLQSIFPTQGLNPGLPHCRQMLYHLSHWRSPK